MKFKKICGICEVLKIGKKLKHHITGICAINFIIYSYHIASNIQGVSIMSRILSALLVSHRLCTKLIKVDEIQVMLKGIYSKDTTLYHFDATKQIKLMN